MNGFDFDALKTWADARQTSIEVAEAIFSFAEDDDKAEAIWEDPEYFGLFEKVRAAAFRMTEENILHWGATKIFRKNV